MRRAASEERDRDGGKGGNLGPAATGAPTQPHRGGARDQPRRHARRNHGPRAPGEAMPGQGRGGEMPRPYPGTAGEGDEHPLISSPVRGHKAVPHASAGEITNESWRGISRAIWRHYEYLKKHCNFKELALLYKTAIKKPSNGDIGRLACLGHAWRVAITPGGELGI